MSDYMARLLNEKMEKPMTAQAPSCETKHCNGTGKVWRPSQGDLISVPCLGCPDCQPKPSEGTDDKQLAAIRASCETPARAGTQYQADVRFLFATIERQAGEIETLHARNQSRELRIAELEADLAAARLHRDGFVEKDATNMRLYMDLLMQVVHVVPGETRHESAKRIINQHENQSHGPACAAIAAGDGK